MAEIDFNQVYDGVTLALHHAFPKSRIHGGVIKQDLNDGDFNVLPITANHTEQMTNRAAKKVVFDVIYYPSAAGGRTECLQIAHSLSYELKTIQTRNGDTVHCSSFDVTVEDNIMHCVLSYMYFEYARNSADAMSDLKIK